MLDSSCSSDHNTLQQPESNIAAACPLSRHHQAAYKDIVWESFANKLSGTRISHQGIGGHTSWSPLHFLPLQSPL